METALRCKPSGARRPIAKESDRPSTWLLGCLTSSLRTSATTPPGWKDPRNSTAPTGTAGARRAGYVPCTYFWIMEGGTFLGSLAIRHVLNDFLFNEGAHIGYSVRPSARRRGH